MEMLSMSAGGFGTGCRRSVFLASSPPEGATGRDRPPRGGLPDTSASGRGASFYAPAAVCVVTGAVSAMPVGKPDTEALGASLGQMSRELSPGEHAVLIWDGAGYHTSGGLDVP